MIVLDESIKLILLSFIYPLNIYFHYNMEIEKTFGQKGCLLMHLFLLGTIMVVVNQLILWWLFHYSHEAFVYPSQLSLDLDGRKDCSYYGCVSVHSNSSVCHDQSHLQQKQDLENG